MRAFVVMAVISILIGILMVLLTDGKFDREPDPCPEGLEEACAEINQGISYGEQP